jgi:hypothetical protein
VSRSSAATAKVQRGRLRTKPSAFAWIPLSSSGSVQPFAVPPCSDVRLQIVALSAGIPLRIQLSHHASQPNACDRRRDAQDAGNKKPAVALTSEARVRQQPASVSPRSVAEQSPAGDFARGERGEPAAQRKTGVLKASTHPRPQHGATPTGASVCATGMPSHSTPATHIPVASSSRSPPLLTTATAPSPP